MVTKPELWLPLRVCCCVSPIELKSRSEWGENPAVRTCESFRPARCYAAGYGQYRTFSCNYGYLKMPVQSPLPDGQSHWRIAGLVVFVIVVALFSLVSLQAGMRGLGVSMTLAAGVQITVRRIPYGWEGKEPSGYITGFPAVLICLLMGAIGMMMIVRPDFMLTLFGWVGA